jgi:DNA polymerase-3 subunit gamma/tau
MTYIPLPHKYRPQTFADLAGQEAIAQTLTHAITTHRLAPAYLFTGVRGTGKTSSARILAKSLNCLDSPQPTPFPCGQCASCRAIATHCALDVTELDAASNNGVEQIRDLIDKAQFAPLQGRYKVWILDEAHALSNSATQALLKTLEEPPEKAVFILCTTEPQKLGATLISRCQRFNFRPIRPDVLSDCLRAIARAENININEGALGSIAQLSQGGLRDALTLLDQLRIMAETITCQEVYDLVGSVPEQDLLELLQAIAKSEPDPVLSQVRKLFELGKDPWVILHNLLEFYTHALIAQTSPQSQLLSSLSCQTRDALRHVRLPRATLLAQQQHLRACESQIKFSRQPRLMLEVALLGVLSVAPAVVPPPVVTASQTSSLNPLARATRPHGGDSQQIWQRVIELQTPTLKALLSQQVKLVAFDGHQAQIRALSSALKPRLENSISALEIGFYQVISHPVKVTVV